MNPAGEGKGIISQKYAETIRGLYRQPPTNRNRNLTAVQAPHGIELRE